MLNSLMIGKKKKELPEINKNKIPPHIAIIMDGNGRWAKRYGMPRSMGHAKGAEVLKKIVREANNLNVKALTVYAFSTENWKRPVKEVAYIMNLLEEYLKDHLEELYKENVRIRFIGDSTILSDHLQDAIKYAINKTQNNKGLTLQIALNYGGRDELRRAIVHIASDIKQGKITEKNITEEYISSMLDTKEFSDVDLLIRPASDYRISNFLLWQLAYAEFWFTDKQWPEFTVDIFREAILAYQNRERRFGGLKKEDEE